MNFDDVRKILKENGFKEVRINDKGEFKNAPMMDSVKLNSEEFKTKFQTFIDGVNNAKPEDKEKVANELNFKLDMDETSEEEFKKLIEEAENFDFNKSNYNKRYDDLMKNIEKHPLGEIASNQAWNNFVMESIEYGIKISKDCIIGRDKESNKWFMFYNKTKTSHIILNKKLSGLLDAIDKDVKENGKTFDLKSEKSLKNLQQFMEEFFVTMILELEKYTTIDQIL